VYTINVINGTKSKNLMIEFWFTKQFSDIDNGSKVFKIESDVNCKCHNNKEKEMTVH
jgi:hypothetical protein